MTHRVPRPDGYVLAGGASRRMGADKARVEVEGQPMALRVADALMAHCGRVAIVRKTMDDWPLRVILDPDPSRHPLWGLVAGLRDTRTEGALFAPCDLPWLRSDDLCPLLLQLPCVAWDGTRRHPLVAHLPRDWADALETAARDGCSVHDALASAPSVLLPAPSLRNANRPEDLQGCKPTG